MKLGKNLIGSLTTFTYDSPSAHDRYPQILVLHNDFEGCVHGINFNYLTNEELDFIKSVLNDDYAEEASKANPNLKTQLDRMKTLLAGVDIKSPAVFYNQIIRPFIKRYDSYRLYKPDHIKNTRTLITYEMMIGTKPGMVFSDYQSKLKHMVPQKQVVQPKITTQTTQTQTPARRPMPSTQQTISPLSSVPNPVRDQSEFFKNLGKK